MTTTRFALLFSALFLLVSPSRAQTVLRVDAAVPTGGDGTTWADAFGDLQEALDAAAGLPAPVEIWLASGTYVPSLPTSAADPRTVLFLLPPDVSLRGGFAGGEEHPDERVPGTSPAVLSGDLLGDDLPGFANRSDNAYRVLQTVSSLTPVVVERLTITGGNANGTTNRGGGMLAGSSSAIPRVEEVLFVENEAINGGAFSADRSCALNACTFRSNRASFGGGAIGLVISLDWITVTNSLFEDNHAQVGGALHAFYAGVAAASCTFLENVATSGVGGALAEGTPGAMGLNNCIFWHNQDPTGTGEGAQLWGVGLGSISGTFLEHCNVSGWTGALGGSGNHGLDPLFVDPLGPDGVAHSGDEDLRPGLMSPNLDAGRNTIQVHPSLPSFSTVPDRDLAGVLRVVDGDGDGGVTIDIGAHERLRGPRPVRRSGSGLPWREL